MNYLAHLYLAHPYKGLITGNFIADSVKGHDYNNYPDEIKNGILMHRAIDDFTDHHPLILESKKYFVKEFDKYSGVLIDIYFDYFLAVDFEGYSDLDLQTFSNEIFTILKNDKQYFGDHSQRFYTYMTRENILVRYAQISGIEQVLKGMTYRIKNRMILNDSLPAFIANKDELQKKFVVFFHELQLFCKKFKN